VGTIFNYPGLARLSPADLRAFEKAAAIIDVHPNWLGAVMQFESGFDPSRPNGAGSGAMGLIQFMPSTARKLGTTTAALSRMTFQEQLPYVIKYFGEKAGLRSLEDTYLKVFYPKYIHAPLDTVVASEGEDVYIQNVGFDSPDPKKRKGYITVGDITSTIRAVYNSGKARGEITIPLA
jgi:hypothetical protein